MPDPNDGRLFSTSGGQQLRAWSPEFYDELNAYSPLWKEQSGDIASYRSGASKDAPKSSEFFVGYDSEDPEKQRMMNWILQTLLTSRDFPKPKNYKSANPNDEVYNQLTNEAKSSY